MGTLSKPSPSPDDREDPGPARERSIERIGRALKTISTLEKRKRLTSAQQTELLVAGATLLHEEGREDAIAFNRRQAANALAWARDRADLNATAAADAEQRAAVAESARTGAEQRAIDAEQSARELQQRSSSSQGRRGGILSGRKRIAASHARREGIRRLAEKIRQQHPYDHPDRVCSTSVMVGMIARKTGLHSSTVRRALAALNIK